MLLMIGKVLDVTTRHVTPANSAPFDVRVVAMLVGKSKVEYIDLAKEFDGPVPGEGDEVALRVSVQAYARNDGGAAGARVPAKYSFVAWENASDRIKVATTAS